MFWKFLSVKKMLDALFDERWCSLCLPEFHENFDLLQAEPLWHAGPVALSA